MKTIKRFLILLSAVILVSCGADTELPPERPSGYITGYAIDSAISGGTVDVYSFENGVRGERLGGSTTSSTGAYSVKLQNSSQLVMVEVSGGSYIEEASGKTVPLKEGEKLRSLVNYQLEQTVTTNVTPLTNMATALAEYKISDGVAVQQAIDEAFGTIQDFFGIDSRGTTSINISTEPSTPVTLDEAALYGFYMAGMSSWTAQASRDSRVPEHTTYTSAGLAQVMYHDVRSDGLLNGRGFNSDETALVSLALGNVPLTADEYRLAFSIHMLAMANNVNINKTGLGIPDLSAAAEEIANKTSDNTDLLSTVLPLDIDTRSIGISLAQPKVGYYHGDFDFELIVEGILGIDQINIMVDGSDATGSLVGDPLIQPIVIDSTQYSDGPHTITVQVWNALGEPYTDTLVFDTQFDNTGPQIELPDIATLTNMAEMTLSFTVIAEFAELQSVEANFNGNSVGLTVDGDQREATLALDAGENTLTIVATDSAGNESLAEATIYQDQIAPVIDTSAAHTQVQFSDGDGTSTPGSLANDNLTTPIYLETDYDGFNTYGKELLRSTLESDGIPYFAFTVSDERNTGVATLAQDLIVRLQYERSGVVLNDWHPIAVQPQCNSTEETTITSCEYLIPLLSEILDPSQNITSPWHESTPQDSHYIRIELDDGAGNTADVVEFSFKVDFYVPPITLEPPADLADDTFANYNGAGFLDRGVLMDGSFVFDSTEYTFVNPANKPIYIHLSDVGNHTAVQTQEQWQREHEVEKTTSTVWQVQQMFPTSSQCPTATAWGDISQIYDYNGTTWDLLTKPLPVTILEKIPQDDLPSPSDNGWSPVPQDDNIHKAITIQGGGSTWTYDYDYTLAEPIFGNEPAAYLANWSRENGSLRTCTPSDLERYFFRQREEYTYALLNGPEDILTILEPTQTPFNTNGFTVLDDTATEILPNAGGWYVIPANMQITIRKTITTPTLPEAEANFVSPASYTNPEIRDRSIAWNINRDLTITAIHNATDANIGAMSTRDTISDTGIKAYTISRQ